MKSSKPKLIEVNTAELEPLWQRAKAALSEEDYDRFKALVESYVYVTQALEDKHTTINRLRKLLFGSCSEKTSAVFKTTGEGAEPSAGREPATPDGAVSTPDSAAEQESPAPKPKGHGRNGAGAYTGADKINVPHEFLESGDSCPECRQGQVYELKAPGVLIRIVGRSPVQATVYELQKLRCNLCGAVFTAGEPEGVGSKKYDSTAASMIALLKYGSGMPFNRLEGLQGNLGIPLPASTQWDIVNHAAKLLNPVYEELIRQAAQGEVLYNDDTTMKILALTDGRAKQEAADAQASKRTGVFTSGIVSTMQDHTIALFFTGRRHAGENLATVLAHRAEELNPPLQMCDALSRNEPKEFETILSNCLTHARRRFTDVVESFPQECRFVVETLRGVYGNDALTRKWELTPEERLWFHQFESGPLMAKLEDWLTAQFEEKLVEPNSGLGQAISYMRNHWEKLTLFLRKPAAPLDNNITERALKRAILHRKNALFYKTEHGAHVGDLFMSLIHTCRLCGADPFDYLTQLQEHAKVLSANVGRWMPWNYRDELKTFNVDTEMAAGYV